MLATKSLKENSVRKNNGITKSRKRKEIDFGLIFKFVIYGVLSCQAGLVLGYLMHLIY